MADKKISELVSADALSGAELIETVQGGVNKRTTAQDIANLANSGHVIEDEGTPLTARTKLNFVGDGVTVTDDAGDDATVVTIVFNVLGTSLTGYAVGSNAALAATDTILEAFGKIQAQLNAKLDAADLDRASVSISAGTLTLDMNSKRQRRFLLSATASSAFTLALSNTTNAQIVSLDLNITGTVAVTMPSSFRMDQDEVDRGRWNTSTRVLTLTGDTASPFELVASFDGTVWKLKASRKYV